jgi:hypothetical protein
LIIKDVVKLLKIQFCNQQGWYHSVKTIQDVAENICNYLIEFYKNNYEPTYSSSATPNFTNLLDQLKYLVDNAICKSNAIGSLQVGLSQVLVANKISGDVVSIQSIDYISLAIFGMGSASYSYCRISHAQSFLFFLSTFRFFFNFLFLFLLFTTACF